MARPLGIIHEFEGTGVTITRERGQRDKRYIYLVVRDGDQELRDFDKDGYVAAWWFAEGYRMAKAVWKDLARTAVVQPVPAAKKAPAVTKA